MPRFSILTHDHPFPHWDFLLEQGDTCRTWRLTAAPDSGGEVIAEPLPDHRLLYLEYEGPVSGNRGTVSLWDTGTFEWLADENGIAKVELHGRVMKGVAQVETSKTPASSPRQPTGVCTTFRFTQTG